MMIRARFLLPFTAAALAVAAAISAETLAAEILPVQNDRGPMLNIPGLPPIPMPPGSRVFGPNGEGEAPFPPQRPRQLNPRFDNSPGARPDRDAAESETLERQKPAPKVAAGPPKTREEVIADLFDRLGKAKDEPEARGITRGIERMWQISGSDTADLLATRAREAVGKKNFKLAIELYDKIVVLEPEWSEGWNQRATARFYQEDDAGAIEDIARTLALEPRHFGALTGLGFILKRNLSNARALQAFRKSLEISPQQERVKKQIEELTLEVDGRGI